ncbi:MAG: hypothetical protein JJE39_13130 [Vicinamibacteria bacterium]|nr:hypothetical protein [Vicinamibacteria bacterium]
MTMFRNVISWAWPALAIFVSACGSNTPTSPTDATTTTPTATVTATASPDTVTASASTDRAYAWNGTFVVTITNTNISPLTIRSIAADLQQSSGGIVITPVTGTDESFRFDVRAPGNRVDINGSIAIPFTFYYTLPNGDREALISISFSVATDNGGAGAVTTTVNLQ